MDKLDMLAWLLQKVIKDDSEGAVRFMLPHADRMRAMGVSEDDITKLGYIAIREANGTTLFPGGIMRDFANVIEAKLKTSQEIIQHYESEV